MENVALHLHTIKVCSFTAMNIKEIKIDFTTDVVVFTHSW